MKLLDVNGLSKSFGGVTALRQVQGHSVAGETLGMIGPNGSGKTTFVNIVSGHIRPDAGSLTSQEKTRTNWRQLVCAEPIKLCVFFHRFQPNKTSITPAYC